MENRPVPQNGWGFVTNKHLFEFLQEHQESWDQREQFIRSQDPKIKNTIVERKKYEKAQGEIVDYYDEVMKRRDDLAIREETGWRQDVERDEGMVLDFNRFRTP